MAEVNVAQAAEPVAAKADGQSNGTSPAARRRTARVLPTDRIQFEKQMQILRAFAVASGPENKAVSNGDVAELVKLTASTVSMNNAFYTSIGLLQKTDAGFLPAPEVVQLNHAYQWNPDTAAQKLQPILERTWFMQALLPKLRFHPTIEEREAIEVLAAESQALPQHRNQLQTLLQYAEVAGIISMDGGQVRLVRASSPPPVSAGPTEPQAGGQPMPNGQTEKQASHQRSSSSPLAAALFPSNAEGRVQFNVSVTVNMAEFAGWQADRIASFFAGIAQVLAARGKAEGLPEVTE